MRSTDRNTVPAHFLDDYDARCEQATADQGLVPVVEELWTAGIPVEIAQTGGFVMVAFVHGRDGQYLGITASERAEGGFLVCGYRNEDGDEGNVVADMVRPEHLADYARGFIRSHGARGPAIGDRVWTPPFGDEGRWFGTVTTIEAAMPTKVGVEWDRGGGTIVNVAHLHGVEASVTTAALRNLLRTWTADYDTVYDGVQALIAAAESEV